MVFCQIFQPFSTYQAFTTSVGFPINARYFKISTKPVMIEMFSIPDPYVVILCNHEEVYTSKVSIYIVVFIVTVHASILCINVTKTQITD